MKLRLGIVVGIFMALLSLYPQIYFQVSRGADYKGSTFFYDYDEPAYAAYLQALIDGRPRKNSIYQSSTEPQVYENLLSIQFVAPYLIAVPSRFFGFSADTAFLLISVVAAFLAGLSVYLLLCKLTENPYLAAIGTLFVLLFGTNVSGASLIKELIGFGASSFYPTFLRRYTPAIPFPFISVLIGFIWMGVKSNKPKEKYLYAVLASFCFAFLVYSYFFYWTAMLAWLVFIAGLNLIFQRDKHSWNFWGIIFISVLVILIPYFLLLLDRNTTTDSAQILENTRKLVFLRPSLIVGLSIFLATIFAIKMKWIELQNQTTIFIISLSALPLIVFNQQIVTGYSLQPMHYNMYILNYLVLLSLVLFIGQLFTVKINKIKPIYWLLPAILCGCWGIIEINYTTKYRFGYNLRRDESFLVNRRLAEIAKTDFSKAKTQITFCIDSNQCDNQPTIAPQGVLWSEHLYLSGNLSSEEHQKRYFLFSYFQGKTPDKIRFMLQSCPNEECRALIGWRVNPTLSFYSSQVTNDEINLIVEKYSQFIQNISAEEALNPTISYLILPQNWKIDLSNFERWYEKENGEQIGNFTLYKVKHK